MQWHDISDPAQRKLDDLAATYRIHPLHIEDCRQAGQRAKLATGEEYLFVCLKLFAPENRDRLAGSDLALFVGREFVITVHTGPASLLEPLHASNGARSSDGILISRAGPGSRIVPGFRRIAGRWRGRTRSAGCRLADPVVVENVGEIRSRLLQFQRVLNATRHIAFQLRHVPDPLISKDLSPFLRDVHDDLAIILDLITGQRDRLAAVLDIYLSSVANRTTEATKTLTLLGTVALPPLVITSLFGMNIEYPAWTKSPHVFPGLLVLAVASTLFLVVSETRRLPPRRQHRMWWPGGSPPVTTGKTRHLKRDPRGDDAVYT
jgi:magnesium transporter